MTELEQFAGTWKLVSLESRRDDEAFHPLGQDCKGILFLDAGGTLSVQLMNPKRPSFESGDNLNGTGRRDQNSLSGFPCLLGPIQCGRSRGQAAVPGRG